MIRPTVGKSPRGLEQRRFALLDTFDDFVDLTERLKHGPLSNKDTYFAFAVRKCVRKKNQTAWQKYGKVSPRAKM